MSAVQAPDSLAISRVTHITKDFCFPGWTQTPIPGVSLSAGGLLALADLSTVAQRTAIKGGSSWLDSLLLVPGLHYQQAVDELARVGGGDGSRWIWGRDNFGASVGVVAHDGDVGESFVGGLVNNTAMAMYLNRVADRVPERAGEVLVLDVGELGKQKTRKDGGKGKRSDRADTAGDDDGGGKLNLGWVSHLLYLMGPILTVAALVMMVLVRDWWALGCIITLVISRILNIWVIKQRARKNVHFSAPADTETQPPSLSQPPSTTTVESSATHTSRLRRKHRRLEKALRAAKSPPPPALGQPELSPSPPAQAPNKTQIIITLPGSADRIRIRLRGSPADLRAVTTQTWMRAKTQREGYLEAIAKLFVYLVAAVSGNWTQAGAIVIMVLLLVSAGLLALSNGSARGVEVNGRIVAARLGGDRNAPVTDGGDDTVSYGRGTDYEEGGECYGHGDEDWVEESGRGGGGMNDDDWAERGMAATARTRGHQDSGYIYP